jgi:hypothetical protein
MKQYVVSFFPLPNYTQMIEEQAKVTPPNAVFTPKNKR